VRRVGRRFISVWLLIFLVGFAATTAPRRAAAQEIIPPGFTLAIVTRGLEDATAMDFTPDGRIFVCQQDGRLRVVKNGVLLPQPFLKVDTEPVGERGLLGVTLDPNFSTNGYVYIYYTVAGETPHNRVSRFTAAGGPEGDVAEPGSEVVILDLDPLTEGTIHNGGAMHFGPDGKLYVAVGENALPLEAQSLDSFLGKMLRLNPDGSIPEDNPFYSTTQGNYRAIWALGLRNPFTFAFQPGTGRMFINDVGSAFWEEINEGAPGANYGWPETEGPTNDPRFRSPLHAYPRSEGRAITGGTFYSAPPGGVAFPAEYVGKYFFVDLEPSRTLRVLDPEARTDTLFGKEIGFPVDIRTGPDGCLYYLERHRSALIQVRYTGEGTNPNGQKPQITDPPVSLRLGIGQVAEFRVVATGTAPLRYQWLRDGSPIPGATNPTYRLEDVTLADDGAVFQCRVDNGAGSVTSPEAVLTVINSRPPTIVIDTPAEGDRYSAGQQISFSARGTDPEEGELPASAMTWKVVFHHDDHNHPFLPDTSGAEGTFTIPTVSETSANVWYRLHITATDSTGLTHTVYRDIHPNTVTLNLETRPAGLKVRLDGQPRDSGAIVGVTGVERLIGVVSPQALNGLTYEFDHWEDDRDAAPTREIATPTADTTYVAVYRVRPTYPYGPGVYLLSTPLAYDEEDAREVFGFTPDAPGYAEFRIADWDGQGYTVREGGPLGGAGTAYFARFGATGYVSLPSRTTVLGPGESRDFVLKPGWNLIGFPFDVNTVPVIRLDTDVTVFAEGQEAAGGISLPEAAAQGLVRDAAFALEGGEDGFLRYVRVDELLPWRGYWIQAFAPVTLRMTAPVADPAGGRSAAPGRRATLPPQGRDNWRLQIVARQGRAADTDNTIGVAPGASDAFDPRYDDSEPPAPPVPAGGAATTAPLTLSILGDGPGGSGRSVPLATSIRSPLKARGSALSWDLRVTPAAGETEEVTLTWPNLNRLPRGMVATLVDVETGRRVPLRSASSYRFRPDPGGAARAFRIEVTPDATQPLALLNVRQTRTGSGDSRSAGTMTHRFAFVATREADVNGEVVSLTGRVVARLPATRTRANAESVLVWNGRGTEGGAANAPLPAGAYVLRLTARDDAGNLVTRQVPLVLLR